MDLIKVAIADINTLLREGLTRIFSAERDLLVVGEAADEIELAEIVERAKPDVLVLGLEKEALLILLELAQKNIPTKVLILSLFSDDERILNAAKAGACGYILKRRSSTTLIDAIRRIHSGDIWVDSELRCAETFLEFARQFRNHDVSGPENGTARPLSKRELEILGFVAQGLTNQEISQTLSISPGTVNSHLYRVFRKLSVNNRIQAVSFFVNAYQQLPNDTGLEANGARH